MTTRRSRGGVAVHHFTTIGSFSFTGGLEPRAARCAAVHAGRGQSVAAAVHQYRRPEAARFFGRHDSALAEAHRLIYRAKVGVDTARELLRADDLLVPAVNHLLSFLQHQHDGRNGRGRDRRRAAA